MLVAILGIHGAGKTTQARMLAEALREMGVAASYHHQLAPEGGGRKAPGLVDRMQSLLSSLLGHKALGRGEGGGYPAWTVPLRRAAATGSVIRAVMASRRWHAADARVPEGVTVLDRHAYDAFPRSRWWYGAAPLGEGFLLGLTPRPGVVLYIEVRAETALQRHKAQEWSREQLLRQRETYERWVAETLRRQHGIVLHSISSDRPLGAVHAQVLRAVRDALEGAHTTPA